ncbi:DUF342 domain-containing protein [Pelovirga terrestris]|uniref:DUF342 domain-containing protein n=1 Tax=Pelovirga terrestris TaxID=2771352 RepID=A0A8J6UNU7_9BACT|nr:FapA family protein [Pelovirga terrestris]MBD1400094.1 DUF342 domain-containing protein [Pelovirga terrestris]
MMASDSHNTHLDPDLLAVHETDSYRLTLRLPPDQMECIATLELLSPVSLAPLSDRLVESIQPADKSEVTETTAALSAQSPPADSRATLVPADLVELLQQHHIIDAIDAAALDNFCACLDQGQEPPPTVVARGTEPQPGTDGWFELLVKVSGEDHQFIPDEKGRIDLKRLNAYTEIEAEQKLGVIHPPEPGIPGITVQGHEIEAPAGKPKNIIAGEGVQLKYGGRMAFATRPGRALFEKNTLTVVDQLVIPGHVDFCVGHIDFHGFVEVKGDILDDFDVRSTKGIKISGHVGACHIESQGSVEVGSMAGREIGHIFCQGNLHARYLNQVTVVCYGDVVVTNEIRNSHIRATGHVVVERGAIIGGEVTALTGVSAAIIGTNSGQRTQITAGVYFPDAERSDYIRRQLHSIEQQMNTINAAIKPLMQHLRKGSEFIDTVRIRLQILNDKLDALHEQKNAFIAEKLSSRPLDIEAKNPKINVQKTLKDGAVIVLGKVREELTCDRQGPLSIIENTHSGGLRFLSLTPLPIPALLLEEEQLKLEQQPPS